MDAYGRAERIALAAALSALADAPPAAQLRVAAALVQDAAYRSATGLPPDRLVQLVRLAAELERLSRG